MKYKEHVIGEPIPSNERICNVCVCLKCNQEHLLGTIPRHDCANSGHPKHRLRVNTTLIHNSQRWYSLIGKAQDSYSCR